MSAICLRLWPLVAVLCVPVLLLAAPETVESRRPVALAVGEGDRLFVADRGGRVCVLDTAKRTVTAEATIGGRLADMAVTADGALVAVDEAAHELIVLSVRDGKPVVEQRLAVARWPVGVSSDGARCFVTS